MFYHVGYIKFLYIAIGNSADIKLTNDHGIPNEKNIISYGGGASKNESTHNL